jgi:hypothetical protein
LLFHPAPNFGGIVNFPIEHDPNRSIFIRHRLMTAFEMMLKRRIAIDTELSGLKYSP